MPGMVQDQEITEWMWKYATKELVQWSTEAAPWCCHEAQQVFAIGENSLQKISKPDVCLLPSTVSVQLQGWGRRDILATGPLRSDDASALAVLLRAFLHNISVLG